MSLDVKPPPLRGKRKLDGVNWTFGAEGGRPGSGVRGRGPPPPVHGNTTVGGRMPSISSSGSLEPQRGGAGVVARPPLEVMEAGRSHQRGGAGVVAGFSPGTMDGSGRHQSRRRSVSPASRENRLAESASSTSAGQSGGEAGRHDAQAIAPPRVVPDAAASYDRRSRAAGQPRGEPFPAVRSRADGTGSAKRLHANADAADADADAAGPLPDPIRIDKKRPPEADSVSPSPSLSNLVRLAGGKEEEGEPASLSPQLRLAAGGRFRVGFSQSAPAPDRDGDGNTITGTRNSQQQRRPSKEAPEAPGAAGDPESTGGPETTVVAGGSPSEPLDSASRGAGGATPPRPATAKDVEVARPASSVEGLGQERTVAAEKRSPDRRRGRFGEGGHEGERGEDMDIAFAGGCLELRC